MMINLYRGIVDILITHTEILNKQLIKHIRTFNDGDPDSGLGTSGFWNLLLETTYIFYVKTFVGIGILMSIILAIIFFPLNAMRKAFVGVVPKYSESHPMDYEEPKMGETVPPVEEVKPIKEKK